MRIASVPHGHVYIEHCSNPVEDDGVRRLDDPPPENPAAGAPWWPLVMLDAGWIERHADEFDIYHLHFGFDSIDSAELDAITRTLHRLGKPIVYTVHDLRNPHQPDRRAHEAALDVLIPAADALITLTTGAAAEIERRWHRPATVVPHPHVVPLPSMSPRPARSGRPRVGMHLKSMRPNLDPLPMLDILLAEAIPRGIDVVLDVHADVMTSGEGNHRPDVVRRLRAAAEQPGVELHVHDFYGDDELWEYFRSLSLSVLPYRFGTHSGWLEACFDLGTRVLAPRIGYYHDQHEGVLGYDISPGGEPDRRDVAQALDLISGDDPGEWRACPDERLAQRVAVADAHRQIYADLLDRMRT